ncbi:ArgE/DapE family deacylase [Microbacterium sp. QXD-8]|uniref:ArgE/DapE family deacylase n=1 Tax=Microbacterium psychrotolerans TaxID=3068321 RepID=A0ABU0YW08_9MICO|nr:ArgE/DapE family deacylase [Microbacterium sp. QXD-8]MDQ7876514.1 ArgE/DapE family deacylase [Microbacterium sp. QXD-8]
MKETVDQVTAAVDALAPELLDLLAESVQAQSVTGYEEPAIELYRDALTRFGWPVEVQLLADSPLSRDEKRVGRRANLVVRFPGRDRGPIVLNGHIDVVPPGDPADWMLSPFSGRVIDGCLYGRGAVDMKGGIASALLALRALDVCGIRPARDLRLELVIGEETTGVGTRLAISHEPGQAAAAVVLEPSGCRIVPISTGLQFFTVTVVGRSAHTSAPWRGVDAFEKLLTVRARLIEVACERSAQYGHGLFADVPTGIPFAIGQVSAGEYPASIPAVATMSGRIGLMPGEDPQVARTLLVEALESLGDEDPWFVDYPPSITWGNDGLMGWETPQDSEIVQVLVRAHEKLGLAPEFAGFTAGSDAAFYGGQGVPTVIFGPGDVTLAHSPNEHVLLSEVVDAAKALAIALAGAA